MTSRPKASSTPSKIVNIKHRRGIHEKLEDDLQSPIEFSENYPKFRFSTSPTTKKSNFTRNRSNSPFSCRQQQQQYHQSEVSSDYDSDLEERKEEEEEEKMATELSLDGKKSAGNLKIGRNFSKISIIFIIILVVLFSVYFLIDAELTAPPADEEFSLKKELRKLEKKFPHFERDFWQKIHMNLEEVQKFEKPRSVLIIYDENQMKKMNGNTVAKEISKIAVQFLKGSVDGQPVLVENRNFPRDYGELITKYRSALEKNHVMLVENLEEFPGKMAQIFHYFCDEYSAVVPQQSFVIFTVKMVNASRGSSKKIEENWREIEKNRENWLRIRLQTVWYDLSEVDKFEPLFTRISGEILIAHSLKN